MVGLSVLFDWFITVRTCFPRWHILVKK